jgi:hypothetical protein
MFEVRTSRAITRKAFGFRALLFHCAALSALAIDDGEDDKSPIMRVECLYEDISQTIRLYKKPSSISLHAGLFRYDDL